MQKTATSVRHSAAELGPGHSQAISPHPTKPRTSPRSMFRLHGLLSRNFLWSRVGAALEAAPPLYKAFTWAEEKTKRYLFGCRMCAQCALPTTAYACPQTCPKQLRNGPCGGAFPDGRCEVYPEMQCVWVIAYERAAEAGHVEDLRRLVRPLDNRKWGQSSWVNYWRGRDEDLWTPDDGLAAAGPPDL
jgi:Methylene-tetrahydrofolate reductase C terminal